MSAARSPRVRVKWQVHPATPEVSQRCFIALGANLGDPVATVKAAIVALHDLPQAEFIKASSLYRTEPVGLKNQPDFINAVVELLAASSAPELLDSLFLLEARFGRQRSMKNAPRTLDLDLLLYGELQSDDPQLTLPHPRLHQRAFVLAPLAEIAPQLNIAGHGKVSDLLLCCSDQKVLRLPHSWAGGSRPEDSGLSGTKRR